MDVNAISARVNFDFEGSLILARKLWALGDHVERLRASRHTKEELAATQWRGKYAKEFRVRMSEEATSNRNAAGALHREAQDWAVCWSRAMDEQNRRNRAVQVDVVRDQRSGWEQFGDVFQGDDSDSQVKDAAAAAVPVPPTFRATCFETRY